MIGINEKTTDTSLIGRRDAFHVPCILARAKNYMNGGDPVRFIDTLFTEVDLIDRCLSHGCVSPFIEDVEEGELCWIFLNPGVTKNLTHHFVVDIDPTGLKENVPIDFSVDKDEFYLQLDSDDGCGRCPN